MDKYAVLFNYFRQCPQLADLMGIAGTAEENNTIILPQGASAVVQYQEQFDVCDGYECTIEPYPSIYEDFHINCYRYYNPKTIKPPESNINVLTYQDVVAVCDWIKEQNEIKNFPDIGEMIVSIECNPFVPQVRYVDEENNLVCYFITVRLRYVNRTPRKQVRYEFTD